MNKFMKIDIGSSMKWVNQIRFGGLIRETIVLQAYGDTATDFQWYQQRGVNQQVTMVIILSLSDLGVGSDKPQDSSL